MHFSVSNSFVSHFADDTCITYSNNKIKSVEKILNKDINEVNEWLKANRLSLNAKKSKLLFFQSKPK